MVLRISHVWGSMGDVWESYVLFGWTIYACNHDNSIVWKVAQKKKKKNCLEMNNCLSILL